MSRLMTVRSCTAILCLGVMLWSGCVVNFLKPEVGAVARKEASISLVENIPAGIFETGDMRVTYSLVQNGETCAITGKIVFDRSLTDSFEVFAKFFFYISYLDEAGKVIQTVDISPLIHTFGRTPDSLPLKMSGITPPGSKAVAFHYYGEFRTSPQNEGGQWAIHHLPFN